MKWSCKIARVAGENVIEVDGVRGKQDLPSFLAEQGAEEWELSCSVSG